MNILFPQAEQLFEGFLRFGFIPEASYSQEDKKLLVEYYLTVREGLDFSLPENADAYHKALHDRLYPKAEQLLADAGSI